MHLVQRCQPRPDWRNRHSAPCIVAGTEHPMHTVGHRVADAGTVPWQAELERGTAFRRRHHCHTAASGGLCGPAHAGADACCLMWPSVAICWTSSLQQQLLKAPRCWTRLQCLLLTPKNGHQALSKAHTASTISNLECIQHQLLICHAEHHKSSFHSISVYTIRLLAGHSRPPG